MDRESELQSPENKLIGSPLTNEALILGPMEPSGIEEKVIPSSTKEQTQPLAQTAPTAESLNPTLSNQYNDARKIISIGDFSKNADFNEIRKIHVDAPQQELKTYNDAITVEHYHGALDYYMSFQRSRINIDDLGAESREDFVDKSLQQPFPLAVLPPIPEHLLASLNFLLSNSPIEIERFWKKQLSRLKNFVRERSVASAHWYSFAPKQLGKFHRRFPLDVWAALMRYFKLGNTDWLAQFVFGFPIVGDLSQRFAFPVSDSTLKSPLSQKEVFSSASTRFAARSHRPPPNDGVLWKEAMEQVEAGWLEPPRKLSAVGRFVDEPDLPINPAFRFAVEQSSKVRACDDLKDSLTNRLCCISTPITLPDWDLIGAMHLFISHHSDAPWAFLKGDDTSAYKNLPMRIEDSLTAVITLWDGSGECWKGFIPRTLIFGATASVLHYNTFSRLLAILINRLFGIPLLAFYDDLGSPMLFALGRVALETLTGACRLLGVVLKKSKSEWGNPLTFLGLLGHFPNKANGGTLHIALSPDKIIKWTREIEDFLKNGSISNNDLQKLIGKLNFAQSMVFGKCARALIRPLYTWLYAAYYSPLISPTIALILRWWISLIRSIKPRAVVILPFYPKFVIFTDASFRDEEGHMAAFLFHRERFLATRIVDRIAHQPAPQEVFTFFKDTLPIFALEFYTIALAIFEWRELLRGACVTLYTDNTAAFGAVLNAGSQSASVSRVTMRLWQLVAHLSTQLWLAPVASPLNIADLPTRMKSSPWKAEITGEFDNSPQAGEFFFAELSSLIFPPIINIEKS